MTVLEDVEGIAENREVGERVAGDHEEIRRSAGLEATAIDDGPDTPDRA